jgi:cysteine-rich repeat protein
MELLKFRAKLIVIGVSGLLVLILPGSVRAQSCSCPPEDELGFPLGQSSPGPPLFCSYPAVEGEDPNDFFCDYDVNTGALTVDHDAGLCPAHAVCSGAVCGNGTVEAGEQCDDGAANGTPGSCCSATCQKLPDSDGDGVCDAVDACTNIGGGQNFLANPKPRLVLGKINTDTVPGNDTLTLSGRFVIHGGPAFSTVDPGVNGARVLVQNNAGLTRIDAVLPAGAYAGHGTRGWKLSKTGNVWTYVDSTGTPLSGVTHVVIADKSHLGANNIVPGRVQVTVTGTKGTYPVVAGDEPLKAVVVLGGLPEAEAGYCGETAYTAGNCLFNKKVNAITCEP